MEHFNFDCPSTRKHVLSTNQATVFVSWWLEGERELLLEGKAQPGPRWNRPFQVPLESSQIFHPNRNIQVQTRATGDLRMWGELEKWCESRARSIHPSLEIPEEEGIPKQVSICLSGRGDGLSGSREMTSLPQSPKLGKRAELPTFFVRSSARVFVNRLSLIGFVCLNFPGWWFLAKQAHEETTQ